MTQKDDKWLETLKEGDSVFVGSTNWDHEYYTPDRIKRITKTLIVLENSSSRFRLNGTELGEHHWGSGHMIVQDNEETRERIWMLAAQSKLLAVLRSLNTRIDYRTLTHEQLERIIPELTKIRDELIPQKNEGAKE